MIETLFNTSKKCAWDVYKGQNLGSNIYGVIRLITFKEMSIHNIVIRYCGMYRFWHIKGIVLGFISRKLSHYESNMCKDELHITWVWISNYRGSLSFPKYIIFRRTKTRSIRVVKRLSIELKYSLMPKIVSKCQGYVDTRNDNSKITRIINNALTRFNEYDLWI